jgi:hypothetical protein
MTRYQIVFWRDIPVHVKVRDGQTRLSKPLSGRFQETVHRAAYRAKAISGSAYMSEWKPSAWQERQETPEHVLMVVTAELETSYSDERLDELARNKGFELHDG